jgi:hypothetical protein
VKEDRLLLTFDKDFGELVFRRGAKEREKMCPEPNSDVVRNHSLTSATSRIRAPDLGRSVPTRWINERPRQTNNWRAKQPRPARRKGMEQANPKSIFASPPDFETNFGCASKGIKPATASVQRA